MVRGSVLAPRSQVRPLRKRQHPRGQPQDDALLVHRLPQLLLRPHRDAPGQFQGSASQVGHRHLSLPDEPQVGVQHEAAPGPGREQQTAWFMPHRIREAWMPEADEGPPYDGPVEVDETYVGGKARTCTRTSGRS